MVVAVVVGSSTTTLCPSQDLQCSFRLRSFSLSLSPSLSLLSLYHARGEEAAAATLRRVEVGPGERGHRSWTCERFWFEGNKFGANVRKSCEGERKKKNSLVFFFLAFLAISV